MPTIITSDFLDAHPTDVSQHLVAKGLPSVVRSSDAAYEIECPTAVDEQAITDALADFTPAMSKTAWEAAAEEADAHGFDRERWLVVKDELQGLKQYYGLASPSPAQSVLAVKAIIKVLREVIRDSD